MPQPPPTDRCEQLAAIIGSSVRSPDSGEMLGTAVGEAVVNVLLSMPMMTIGLDVLVLLYDALRRELDADLAAQDGSTIQRATDLLVDELLERGALTADGKDRYGAVLPDETDGDNLLIFDAAVLADLLSRAPDGPVRPALDRVDLEVMRLACRGAISRGLLLRMLTAADLAASVDPSLERVEALLVAAERATLERCGLTEREIVFALTADGVFDGSGAPVHKRHGSAAAYVHGALRTLADEGRVTLTDVVCADTQEPIWRSLRRRLAGERR